MLFCVNCGMQLQEGARFCGQCGTPTGGVPDPRPTQSQPEEAIVHSQPVADTSRLSGVGVEKFLAPGERIIHATPGQVRYGNHLRRAYVTDKRVIFYGQQGAMLGIVKQDRLDEVFLNQIRRLKLAETGLMMKKVYLELDEMKVEGQREHLLDLYRAIQSARASG